MFLTEHLEGRLRYETDKVVCIDIYINSNYSQERNFISQVLLSLANKKIHFFSFNLKKGNYTDFITSTDYENEISEGIQQYLKTRKELELDCH